MDERKHSNSPKNNSTRGKIKGKNQNEEGKNEAQIERKEVPWKAVFRRIWPITNIKQ